MNKKLIEIVEQEEARQVAKWGHTHETPEVLGFAAVGELGEVAGAFFHNEGSERMIQEIAETIATLSRLHDMVLGSI